MTVRARRVEAAKSSKNTNSLGVMVRVRVEIRVYVKPFCSAEKP